MMGKIENGKGLGYFESEMYIFSLQANMQSHRH